MQLYYHKLRFIEIITSNWAVILSSFFNIIFFFFQKYFDSFWKPQYLNEVCNGTLWMKKYKTSEIISENASVVQFSSWIHILTNWQIMYHNNMSKKFYFIFYMCSLL